MKRMWRVVVLAVALGGCLQAKTVTAGADVAVTDATGVGDVATTEDGQGGDVGHTDVQTRVHVVPPESWVTHAGQAPYAVHFSWQRDPATTLTVQWSTGATELGTYQPRVWFGPEAEAGADGAGLTYGPGRVVAGSGELYDEAIIAGIEGMPHYVTWTAELTGLQPNTRYVLRVGTWDGFEVDHFVAPDLSQPVSTRTAPVAGDQSPVTIVLAGDSRGGAAKIADNAERFAALAADFWLFNGDFNEQGSRVQWDDWFHAMQPILAHHPLLAVQGNHEFFPPMYYGQFALPVMPGLPDGYQEHAWSLTYGNVHVVGLDSTQDSTVEDQTPWLEADLAAARADKHVQWILVGMHHPAYSACTNHGSTDRVQKWWVPLFEKYDVDLVFAGHDHDYERTWPIRNTQKAASGPIYVVAGGFFSDGYTNGKDWWTATSAHGKTSNYVVLHITGASLQLTAFAGDGVTTLDTLDLAK